MSLDAGNQPTNPLHGSHTSQPHLAFRSNPLSTSTQEISSEKSNRTEHLTTVSNLSTGQMMIWAGQELFPESPHYNMALKFTFRGAIDANRFQAAFQKLVAATDSLRTVFETTGGVPQQRVLHDLTYKLDFVDLRNENDPRETIDQWASDRSNQLFRLDERLFDSTLFQCDSDFFVWYLNQHHLIIDGSSFDVLYERMAAIYRHERLPTALKEPEGESYLDYVSHEQKGQSPKSIERCAKHWRDREPAEADRGQIPFYGNVNSRRKANSERIECQLGSVRSDKLRQLAKDRSSLRTLGDLSLFNVVTTAVFAFLYRISGKTALSLTTPFHNRLSRRFRKTTGAFLEFYPLYAKVTDTTTFDELLDSIVDESFEFVRHAIPGASRAATTSTSEVFLNFIQVSFPDFCEIDTSAEWIPTGYIDPLHAIRVQISDFGASGEIQLALDLNMDVFANVPTSDIRHHFQAIVDAFIENPARAIGEVQIISEREQQCHLLQLNDTLDEDIANRSILQQFEESVRLHETDPAVTTGNTSLTYRELDNRSDSLSSILRSYGAVRHGRVAICMRRSSDAIIAILATIKAGAAFVPVDPFSPAERVSEILADCNATVVLADSDLTQKLRTTATILTVPDIDQSQSRNEKPVVSPQDSAYIIYTSGSTGKPKGVVISHEALANYAQWASSFYCQTQRLAFPLFSPMTFDLTITSIFVPLISGGRIVVYPEQETGADLSILDVVDDNQVNIIKLTPSHLALLQGRDLSTSKVTQLILGGEELGTTVARKARSQFGKAIQIHNEYGPTEATVGCILHTFSDDDAGLTVPIGRPISNMRAYVLNSQLVPVPAGVSGELFLSGTGLASRYWNRTELTAERFVANPIQPDSRLYRTGDLARINDRGLLECLGRIDEQLKINGVRIEPGEVESALMQLPQIRECVVTAAVGHTLADFDNLTHCANCGLPSNYPDVSFNDQNICNTCTSFDQYQERAHSYFGTMDQLQDIFDQSRQTKQSEYDCIALLSGGKDSTYALCRLVDMGLNVLAFTLDNGYISESAKANIRRVVKTLGVDHIFGSTPAMNTIFADSLDRHANVCHGCFKTIYTLGLQLARKQNISVIVTGLSRGQLFETRLPPEAFNGAQFSTEHIDRTILNARKAYHRIDDAVSQNLDVSMFEDDSIFDQVEFIDFFRYCDVELHEMYSFLSEKAAWERPSDTGRSTNCLINDVGIFVHKKRKGYHNYALPYAWDVRMGHKKRDEAIDELDDDIDPKNALQILQDVGYDDVAALESQATRLVAFYTAEQEIASSVIQSHLRDLLPSYMQPAEFRILDQIPLTANGKADRKALPRLPGKRLSSESGHEYLAPANFHEQKMAEIWADVLQVDQVGVADNFFDLGGDSIAAIQIVSRARQADLGLTPADLFETLTVRLFVRRIAKADYSPQGQIEGTVYLNPVQEWFFAQQHAAPGHFNQIVRLQLHNGVNPNILAECMSEIVHHHDALRLQFRNTNQVWRAQSDSEATNPVRIEHYASSAQTDDEYEQDLCTQEPCEFDLSRGPLVRIVSVTCASRPTMLLISIHHLAIDLMSWEIVLEDIESAYRLKTLSKPVLLPLKTTSFRDWSERLITHAQSATVEDKFDYWQRLSGKQRYRLLDDPNGTSGIHAEFKSIKSTISVALTEEIAGLASRQNCGIEQILLSALTLVASKITGHSSYRFDVEHHGREPFAVGLDVTRTVGWFTSIYPVEIKLPDKLDTTSVLESTRQQLEKTSEHGFEFGMLRYLADKQSLRNSSSSELVFNYLGNTNRFFREYALFKLTNGVQLSSARTNTRAYPIELVAGISNRQLFVEWGFAATNELQIHRIAQRFVSQLKDFVASGTSVVPRYTSADLGKRQLDRLAKLLGQSESDGE